MSKIGFRTTIWYRSFLLMLLLSLFVFVNPAWAYSITSVTHTFVADPQTSGLYNAILTRRCLTANYHWLTAERLSPSPAQLGAWSYGAINNCVGHYPVYDMTTQVVKICVGASDTSPSGSLYDHANNRCYRVWRSGNTAVSEEIFNIYGKITDSNGSALSGVTVSDGAGHTATTDSNGDYTFTNLTSATYTLTPSKSDYVFSPSSRAVSGGPPYHVTDQNFSGAHPTPSLSNISPTSTTIGGSSFTLTVNGSNFINGSVVRWNGSNRTTTFVSSTQLQATIAASDIATAGTANVTVYTASPGGGTSSAKTFTINNLVPVSSGISPTATIAGGSSFVLTVSGRNFVNGSVVRWNGADRTTTFVSSTQLQATITAADITTAGTAAVTVYTPSPGGGTSGAQSFTINNPVSVLSGLTPTSVLVGGNAFTLTVTGSNFVEGSIVRWNGSDRTTTFASSTQLQAAITADDIVKAGTATVTVYTPGPGGGTSNARTFTINNAVPSLSGMMPLSIMAGEAEFVLTVTGSNFVSESVVRWKGFDRTTTFVSSTELQAAITAADVAKAGTAAVTVYTSGPGGGTSSARTFTINNPAPVLSGLDPTSVVAGGNAFVLTVSGSNFVDGSVVRWNGSNRTTTFMNSAQLQATITKADISNAGTAEVTVYTPGPGGGTSEVKTVTVNNPVPSVSGLTPAFKTAGEAAFTLTVTGSNFVNGSVARWNGVDRTTTFVNSTQLYVAITAADIETPGTAQVTVYNPVPGGGVSNTKSFVINNPVPLLSGLSPASIAVGSEGFILTVRGSKFVSGAVVRWNGSDRTTLFISNQELHAEITAADVATMGRVSITVRNPIPGGGTSTALTLIISDPYEPDDTCAQASVIATDGSAQSHTFHAAGDSDWVQFPVAMAQTYVLETSNVVGGADTVLELYDACSGLRLGWAGDTLGPGARLLWTPATTGTLYLKVSNTASGAYGVESGYELSIRENSQQGVAIIVAGHNDQNILQSNINYDANLAYRVFTRGKFRLDHVYYLNNNAQDADDDGDNDVNAVATLDTLHYAIGTWAKGLVDAETPLYLYLVDHGGNDAFLLNGSDELLMTAQLNTWLNDLEESTTVEKIVVVIEACRSGSFIKTPTTISKSGRIIITSTDDGKSAFSSAQGAYFSDAFFTALSSNKNLLTSFEQAETAVQETKLSQTPWLDDNGDGVANQLDGQYARGLGFANPFGEEEPVVLSATVQLSSNNTGLIIAHVDDDIGVDAENVWAEVYPPSFVEPVPGDDFETPVLDIPRVPLSASGEGNIFASAAVAFDERGVYRVVIYALDQAGNSAIPLNVLVQTRHEVYVPLVLKTFTE